MHSEYYPFPPARAVYPGKPGTLHQILCEAGYSVSVPHCSAAHQLHHLHAHVAARNPQVWQEDDILRGNVDPLAPAPLPPLCRKSSNGFIPTQLPGWNGCFLCLSTTMVWSDIPSPSYRDLAT